MSIPEEKNILLFGATGKTGAQIYRELRSRNIKLSVFVREESVNKLKGNGQRIIHGNVLNYSDVEAAIIGDAYTDIIISIGSKMLRGSELRSIGTGHIIKALQSSQSEGRLPSSSIMRSDVAKFLVDSMLMDRNGISAICHKK